MKQKCKHRKEPWMERVRPLVLYHYFEKKEENTSDHHCDFGGGGVLVVSLNNYGPGPKQGTATRTDVVIDREP